MKQSTSLRQFHKHSTLIILTIVLFSFFYLWAVSFQQPTPVGEEGGWDDLLFLRRAENIISGDWMGPYNKMTLVKGPFYPLWIASAFKLSIPLLFSQHLFYIFASVIFILSIYPWLNHDLLIIPVFLLLLFNPISYHGYYTKILREGIYPTEVILVISCALGLFIRQQNGILKTWYWIIGLGLSLTAFWLTREEGIWMLPIILLFLALGLYKSLRIGAGNWKVIFSQWLIPIGLFISLILSVNTINYVRYGVFAKTEFDAKPFTKAYQSLLRVKPDVFLRAVPVTSKTLQQLYKISPSLKELRPFLENSFWKGSGKEIPGAYFMWAFRDAVSDAGYYSFGRFPDDFYNRLSQEIDTACEQRKLQCYPKFSFSFAPIRRTYIKEMIKPFISSYKYIAQYSSFSATVDFPYPANKYIEYYRNMTNENITIDTITIKGFAFTNDPNSTITIKVSGKKGSTIRSEIYDHLPSIDLYKDFNITNAKTANFIVISPCQSECTLQFLLNGTIIHSIPFDRYGISNWGSWQSNYTINISSIDSTALQFVQADKDTKSSILYSIWKIYHFLIPVLFPLSVLIFVVLGILMILHKFEWWKWVIIAGHLLVLSARLALIAYIDVSSYPALNFHYLSAAYPLMLIFIILTFLFLFHFISNNKGITPVLHNSEYNP